jgi:hypothetical protein
LEVSTVNLPKLNFCSFSLQIWAFGLLLAPPGWSQQDTPGGWAAFHPNQEVRVSDLPTTKARSDDPSDVLMASLEVAFDNKNICCGRNSVLEDSALAANPLSLKDIAARVQGRHLLSDGRPIHITAELLPASSGDIGYRMILALSDQHPLLLVWNSHLYVLAGAIFDETLYSDGTRMDVIHKLQLLDTRFSDSRRDAAFNRQTDDWSKVEGALLLRVTPD